MKRLLLGVALPFAFAATAFADGHMAKFPDVVFEADKDFYASDLIGMRVYQSEEQFDTTTALADGSAQEWDDIGEIGSLVVSTDGKLERAVIDVGGFLGLGEKPVVVTFDELRLLKGDGDLRIYVNATQEELEAQPEYEG